MVAIRIKGIKRAKAKGKVYYYHRKTGRRINGEPGSGQFMEEVKLAEESIKPAPKPVAGTLGQVIDLYRASKFYTERAEETRLSYDRAIEVLKPLRAMPLLQITSGFAAGLRDSLAKTRGRWIVNYTLTVLSILLDFAVERDLIKGNPVDKVKRIPKPTNAKKANRPWEPHECRAVLEAAPEYLRVPIGLAMLGGFRKADCLSASKTALDGDRLLVRTGKRGKLVRMPIHPELKKILAEAPAHEATTISANSWGKPWTKDGFNTVFGRLIRKLESEGRVDEGLTIHGLRHTLGTRLKEAGAADEDIARLLGQSSLAMARHYSENADTTEQGRTLINAADVFGNMRETKLENRRSKNGKPTSGGSRK